MIVTRIVYKEKPNAPASRTLRDFEIRCSPNGPIVWRGRQFISPDYMERSIRIALKVLGGVETSCS